MDKATRDYLAAIGRRGGTRSRRLLDPAIARGMVRVREARGAFKRHRPEEIVCLDLVAPFDRVEAKAKWLAARDDADGCAREIRCL